MTKTVKLEHIRHDYGRLVKDYEQRWRGFLAAPHRWVLDRLDAPRKVLDLGCGTGQMLVLIHDNFERTSLTGIDASPAMLSIARAKAPYAAFREADLEHLPPPEETYDTVLSINVLHHLNDPEGHIGSLHDLCAENGRVFLCDFAIEGGAMWLAERFWRLFHPAHHKAYARAALRRLLTARFNIEDEAMLSPDRFWRLQIYQLRKAADLSL